MAGIDLITLHNPRENLLGKVQVARLNPQQLWKYAQIHCLEPKVVDALCFNPELRVVFTLKGRTHLNYGGLEIELSAGQGAVLPCYADEREGEKRFYVGEMQQELVLFCDKAWLVQYGIEESVIHILTCQEKAHYFNITASMRLLLVQLLQQQNGANIWLLPTQLNLFNTLMIETLQHLFPASNTETSHSKEKYLTRLMELLHSGEADDLTLPQIAKACYSNPTTLQKTFQQAYGMSIAHYLRNLKLKRAKQALQIGSSVNEAAALAGYKNSEYFSKQFHKTFGVYPSQL